MAFQIRRAYRFLPPSQNHHIALCTSNNRISRNKVPCTLSFILRSVFTPEKRSRR